MDAAEERSPEVVVRYTPAMVRGAVRTFVGRRLREQRGIWIATVLLLCFAASLACLRSSRLAAVYSGGALVPVALALLIWLAQHRRKMAALRRMGMPTASVRWREDGLEFQSGAGIGSVPFASVAALWERPDCLLLVTGRDAFTILPTADLPLAWPALLAERCR